MVPSQSFEQLFSETKESRLRSQRWQRECMQLPYAFSEGKILAVTETAEVWAFGHGYFNGYSILNLVTASISMCISLHALPPPLVAQYTIAFYKQ